MNAAFAMAAAISAFVSMLEGALLVETDEEVGTEEG